MFGYVSSSAAFVSVLGDLLASTTNQNVTSWRSAPGPAAIERLAVGWIGEMVGYDPAAVGEADDFEQLAPVVLSIVCFRYVPDAIRRARDVAAGEVRAAIEPRLDALNEAITIEAQRSAADAYFSNATLNGRFVMRACLVNYRTTEADLVRLLDTVRDVAGSLTA